MNFDQYKHRRLATRMRKDKIFVALCVLAACFAIVILATLLLSILRQGLALGTGQIAALVTCVLMLAGGGLLRVWAVERELRRTGATHRIGSIGLALVVAAAAGFALVVACLIWTGQGFLDFNFIRNMASPNPKESGILPALVGTILICGACAMAAIPLGVGTAILLEEFKPKHWILRKLYGFVQLNITNLAGVPSIVYGILGITVFVNMFGLFGTANSSSFTFGQTWYDQYVDEGRNSYYIQIDSVDTPSNIAGPELPFLDATLDEDGKPALELVFRTPDQLRPEVSAMEADIEQFEDTISEGIDTTRNSRRGPAQFDEASAQMLVAEALAGTTFKIDIESLEPVLIEKLVAMDGLKSSALRNARREAIKLVKESEYETRFAGVMMLGKEPVRVNRKAWYFISFPFGRGVLAGGLTLMLVVLPIIIISTQEALRAVPDTMRQGALALGATRWQTIRHMSLLAAIPGICTGTILAMSRAIGEAAPILILAGAVYISFLPKHLMDSFTAMPLQIYNWASRPQAEFHDIAAAGIIVLLAVLLTFNGVAVLIRQKFQRSD